MALRGRIAALVIAALLSVAGTSVVATVAAEDAQAAAIAQELGIAQ